MALRRPRRSARITVAGLALATFLSLPGCDEPDSLPLVSEVRELLELDREEPFVYYYIGDRGQRVFTNDLSLVPRRRQLMVQRMDLAHVSLNEELGSELVERIEAEHERLSESEPCVEAREASEAGLLPHTLERHPHLWGFGAIILALFLVSPFIARRVGGAMWFRTMVFLVPILCTLALLTHGLRMGTESMRSMRETASLCDPNAPGTESPALRLQMVETLRRRHQNVDSGGQPEIEEILRMNDAPSP